MQAPELSEAVALADAAGTVREAAAALRTRFAPMKVVVVDAFDMRGEPGNKDEAIFLHNGPGRYDFVIANGKTGPGFAAISFADKGDLDKAQILQLLKAAGYEIEQSGGIQGGKLVLDAK